MILMIKTRRIDRGDESLLIGKMEKIGWTYAGGGGIANISYLFTWRNTKKEPVIPQDYNYEIF